MKPTRDFGEERIKSMAFLDAETREVYLNYYRHVYSPGLLDMKTKELIAVAAAAASGCYNCLVGHIRKAVEYGASQGEIGEAVAVAAGVAAATIVDRTDIANHQLGLVKDTGETPATVGPNDSD